MRAVPSCDRKGAIQCTRSPTIVRSLTVAALLNLTFEQRIAEPF